MVIQINIKNIINIHLDPLSKDTTQDYNLPAKVIKSQEDALKSENGNNVGIGVEGNFLKK